MDARNSTKKIFYLFAKVAPALGQLNFYQSYSSKAEVLFPINIVLCAILCLSFCYFILCFDKIISQLVVLSHHGATKPCAESQGCWWSGQFKRTWIWAVQLFGKGAVWVKIRSLSFNCSPATNWWVVQVVPCIFSILSTLGAGCTGTKSKEGSRMVLMQFNI